MDSKDASSVSRLNGNSSKEERRHTGRRQPDQTLGEEEEKADHADLLDPGFEFLLVHQEPTWNEIRSQKQKGNGRDGGVSSTGSRNRRVFDQPRMVGYDSDVWRLRWYQEGVSESV